MNGDSIGYKGFLKVADEFSGTAAGNLANAYAGICYAQLGKYEDAVKYLDKFSAKDQLVSPAIWELSVTVMLKWDNWTKLQELC